MGRCGLMRGDELGATLIASRLARTAMVMCFALEGKYAPYSKWFGSAFQTWLRCGPLLSQKLLVFVSAPDARSRENAYIEAFRILVNMCNQQTELFPRRRPSNRTTSMGSDECCDQRFGERPLYFFGRPIQVWSAGRACNYSQLDGLTDCEAREFSTVAASCIEDERLKRVFDSQDPRAIPWLAPLDLLTDDTDAACSVDFACTIRRLFDEKPPTQL